MLVQVGCVVTFSTVFTVSVHTWLASFRHTSVAVICVLSFCHTYVGVPLQSWPVAGIV